MYMLWASRQMKGARIINILVYQKENGLFVKKKKKSKENSNIVLFNPIYNKNTSHLYILASFA